MERYTANDNPASDIQRVWDLMKKIGFAMLVTRDGKIPEELPVRGPEGPRTPSPAADAGIADPAGSDLNPGPGELPRGTI